MLNLLPIPRVDGTPQPTHNGCVYFSGNTPKNKAISQTLFAQPLTCSLQTGHQPHFGIREKQYKAMEKRP